MPDYVQTVSEETQECGQGMSHLDLGAPPIVENVESLQESITRYSIVMDEIRLRQDMLDVKTICGIFTWKIPEVRRRYRERITYQEEVERLLILLLYQELMERLRQLIWTLMMVALFSGCSVVNQRMSFLYEYFTVVKLILLLRGGDIERNPGPKNPQPPTTQTIQKLGLGFSSKWMRCGTALGIEYSELEKIEMNLKDKSVDDKCICMLNMWLTKQTVEARDPKWEDLTMALREVGENKLAEKICRKYGEEIENEVYQGIPSEDARPMTSSTHMTLAPLPQSVGIDWERLSEEDQCHFSGRFSAMFAKLVPLLKEAIGDPEVLQIFLATYYHPTSGQPYVDTDLCKEKRTISGILVALHPRFINCTHPRLLKTIVEEFGCEASKGLLEEYEQGLRSRGRKRACNPLPKETGRTKRRKSSRH